MKWLRDSKTDYFQLHEEHIPKTIHGKSGLSQEKKSGLKPRKWKRKKH